MEIIQTESVPLSIQKYIGPPDPRVTGWPLLKSPIPVISIFIFYIVIVIFGPKFMKNRKPYNIKYILLIYNFSQIALSSYIFKEFLVTSYISGYNWACQPVDRSLSPLAIRMASACWWFYFSKVVDLLDTVFFVLRKKLSQLSFLHLYHHSTMIFNWYIGTLYLPGGQAFFSGLINSFVHVIMYTYYLLSAIGPHMQKYLWWKRYLTQLQLCQFVAIIFHLCVGIWNKCEAPTWLTAWTVGYVSSLVMLFSNFYKKAYHGKDVSVKKHKEVDAQLYDKSPLSAVANGSVRQAKEGMKRLGKNKHQGLTNYFQDDESDNLNKNHSNGFVKASVRNGKKCY
uniref:Elongation of very long chain fatty acids protein n=1 Tax=Orthetrum albistylum TaxID=254766 RepID=A0A499U793_9ODON|nr:elongation of very long chain fatty acids protein 5 [Orthetrum albistylum]